MQLPWLVETGMNELAVSAVQDNLLDLVGHASPPVMSAYHVQGSCNAKVSQLVDALNQACSILHLWYYVASFLVVQLAARMGKV